MATSLSQKYGAKRAWKKITGRFRSCPARMSSRERMAKQIFAAISMCDRERASGRDGVCVWLLLI